MRPRRYILVNALSIGGGGGYTVGRELLRHLALARPDWRFSILLVRGHPLHQPFERECLPSNAAIHWAPPHTAGHIGRVRYERAELPHWVRREGIHAVVQLNGMTVPGIPVPTLAHHQDPWPYRPQAWTGWRDRLLAMARRHQHARSLRTAACAGWTSAYLRELVCGYHRITPRRSHVFYNGIPQAWLQRGEATVPPWHDRPPEIVTVSNVCAYKRQDLVIRALAGLIRRPGLSRLVYRIVGDCPPRYAEQLRSLAGSLGVQDHVTIEGRVPDERVEEVYGRARCFVLMSVCESFGIPAIEAMSFGTPVVTSDCCAMPEVCGDAADFVPVDDLPALEKTIERVLCDPLRAEELRQRGFQRVRRFSWHSTAERMAEVLEEIAA